MRHEVAMPSRVCTCSRFAASLLTWYGVSGRRFFWRRGPLPPFQVLVLEMLLARTHATAVDRVAPHLLMRYPDAGAMAVAGRCDIERIIRPLGLFRRRSQALIAASRGLVDSGGGVPNSEGELLALPGVGRYAATATLCFGFGRRTAVVDSNVRRILSRYFGVEYRGEKIDSIDELWQLAARLLPSRNVREYNWALLDLGAAICRPLRPKCADCPLNTHCRKNGVRRRAGSSHDQPANLRCH